MTLEITYFSNNEIHEGTYIDVIDWYYDNGILIIKSKVEEHEMHNVILLNVKTYESKK